MGTRFRAQHPILTYIADFYCHEARLIIEVDGGIHQIQKEYDVARSSELESYGIKVLRFTNIEIMKNLDKVLLRIKNELKSRLSQ
jgi:cyclase